MSKEIVIVFDCGATNARVVALNRRGVVIASESYPNSPKADPFFPAYRIWDAGAIWKKMCSASKKVVEKVNSDKILGVTVTTFGVDGTLFNRDGKMLYPVISWQCERTRQVMKDIDKYIPVEDLYSESGVLPFNFNTINKLIWFNENMPHLLKKSYRFLFMPSIFAYFLTGRMANDVTMAGTSMMTSLTGRKLSENIFRKAGLPVNLMGDLYEPGSLTGEVTLAASADTSIPAHTPVIATGHDTQFAIFGSGAEKNQPVLSSGTWEILMARTENFKTENTQLEMGITTELDSRAGLYNVGNQWIASGILEWARRTFFSDIMENAYEEMISGAEKVPPGSNGIKVLPEFYEYLTGKPGGRITGLTIESTRYEIYRAILEALGNRLAEGRAALENAGGFKTENIICVGGGSKNRLWNKIRANYSGVPVKILDQKETTVLGASLFVQAACGNFASPEEARSAVEYKTETILPD
ncbi:MAG: L-fuculokinase [Bacteroidales bacterium]|nr:L-fuculokinase [Bacteroidales bacterium]